MADISKLNLELYDQIKDLKENLDEKEEEIK